MDVLWRAAKNLRELYRLHVDDFFFRASDEQFDAMTNLELEDTNEDVVDPYAFLLDPSY